MRDDDEGSGLWNHWATLMEKADEEIRNDFNDYCKFNDERMRKIEICIAKATGIITAAILLAPLIWKAVSHLWPRSP